MNSADPNDSEPNDPEPRDSEPRNSEPNDREPSNPAAHDVTLLLRDARGGSADAQSRLYEQVYAELHRIAGSQLSREAQRHSWQPTVLVHEAFLRMVDPDRLDLSDRSHFFAVAVTVMRRVLVDHYRRRRALKRGGPGVAAVTLTADLAQSDHASEDYEFDVLALDDALEALAIQDARKARVVELRFFGGMKVDEVAAALEVSRRTVEADWFFARAWLRRRLDEKD